MLKDFRRTRRLHALRADIVLDGARNAFEEGNLLPGCDFFIDSFSLFQSLFARNRQIRLDITFDLIDAREHIFRELDRGDFLIDEHVMENMRRFII